jgi:cyclopropane fatty-acyl-phospholipid synthase-like methyltransferase
MQLPTEYFCQVLGKWRKYSSCLYRNSGDSLNTAEENMLELYCDKLRMTDGLDVLELGCGWGSFTLFAVRPVFYASAFSAYGRFDNSLFRAYCIALWSQICIMAQYHT